LTKGDKSYSSTLAIIRLFASKTGAYGDNIEQSAMVDKWVEFLGYDF